MTNQPTPSAEENVKTEIIIEALYILASDIQSDDGVAQECIRQAARRMEKLQTENEELQEIVKFKRQTDARWEALKYKYDQAIKDVKKLREVLSSCGDTFGLLPGVKEALQSTNHYND